MNNINNEIQTILWLINKSLNIYMYFFFEGRGFRMIENGGGQDIFIVPKASKYQTEGLTH